MKQTFEKISDAELTVMQILWEAKRPLNVKELRVQLQKTQGWESSTVKTLIHRLYDKGAICQEKRGVYYYTPLIGEEEYNRYATRSLVEKLYGGKPSNLVAALVRSGLSDEDVEELRAMLKDGEGV